MAAPTAKDQRERIEAIITTHLTPTIKGVHDGPECPIAESDLPVSIVLTRGSTRSAANANTLFETCTYEVITLVTKVCDDSVEEQRRVFDATEAIKSVIPDYFFYHAYRLELNRVAFNHVREIAVGTDDGPEFRQWGGEVYGSVTDRISVTTLR